MQVGGSGGTADAHGSGPCEATLLRVQIPSSALTGFLFGKPVFCCFLAVPGKRQSDVVLKVTFHEATEGRLRGVRS